MAWRAVCFAPFDATEGSRRWQSTLRGWLDEAGETDPAEWSLAAAAGRYLQQRAAGGCSPRFAVREFYRLLLWLRWASSQGVSQAGQFDEGLALGFLTWCREERHHVPSTLIAYRQMLTSFGRFLHGVGAIASEPVIGGVGHCGARVERVLSVAEFNELIAALSQRAARADPRWGWHYRRDLLMCKVFIATGLRASELCELRCRDFDPAAGTLTIAGKGSGPFAIQGRRVFVCDPRLLAELRSWWGERPSGECALFPPYRGAPAERTLTPGAIDRLVKSWSVLAGLTRPLHAHLFRHSFCSHLIANGADVYSVQQLMGHRRVEVTLEVYLHLTEGEVREQWQRHSPLATAAR